MRILWVVEKRLLPVQSGGAIRTYHQVRALAARHDVQLLAGYHGPQPDPGYEAALADAIPGARAMLAASPDIRGTIGYLRSRAARSPQNLGFGISPRIQALLSEWLSGSRFDVVVCDGLASSVNFPESSQVPVVLFEHNTESHLLRRQAANATGISWAWRAMLRVEARRMEQFERRAIQRAAHVVAVSQQDAVRIAGMGGHNRVTAISTGVDLESYQPCPVPDSGKPLVMFTGLMSYLPNVDAVGYFSRAIWPRILAQVPSARFRIVGRSPHRAVRELASDTIEVTGAVDSVASQLAEASVVVVPLRAGGGTRLKIYEAMAMARPVVSTHLGAEGLAVRDGDDIILAEDPAAFADAVVRLLTNADARTAVGTAAAATASRFGWPAIADEWERVLESVVSAGA
ncbi:MAG TPA: glycosyltransferase [Tepidiformaceae bacterium]|nr:glycosyltransferase [Tepidiformaceae bacterium]